MQLYAFVAAGVSQASAGACTPRGTSQSESEPPPALRNHKMYGSAAARDAARASSSKPKYLFRNTERRPTKSDSR
jgi:hypothetical protein